MIMQCARLRLGHSRLRRAEQRAFFGGNAFSTTTGSPHRPRRRGVMVWVLFSTPVLVRAVISKTGGAAPVPGQAGFLLRLRLAGEGVPEPDPDYGGQIQDFSIVPETEEATVNIDVLERGGGLSGWSAHGAAFSYSLGELRYGDLHPETVMSPRVAPAVLVWGSWRPFRRRR